MSEPPSWRVLGKMAFETLMGIGLVIGIISIIYQIFK